MWVWLELTPIALLQLLWNVTGCLNYKDWNLPDSGKNLTFLKQQMIHLQSYFSSRMMYYIATSQPVCENGPEHRPENQRLEIIFKKKLKTETLPPQKKTKNESKSFYLQKKK